MEWIDSENIKKENVSSILKNVQGILIPGGFGDRGIEGMINAAEYARTNNIPLLGICLGMQIVVIEYARNVCGFVDANSREFDSESKHFVIDLMEEQLKIVQKGASMRLGAYPCKIMEGTKLKEAYREDNISERHRHRYEFNNIFRKEMQENGLVICGTSPDESLVEAVEVPENDFYVGVQFHPEFKSRPNKPHALFVEDR